MSFQKVLSLSQKASIIPTPENVLELEQEIDVSMNVVVLVRIYVCVCSDIVHILRLNPLVQLLVIETAHYCTKHCILGKG